VRRAHRREGDLAGVSEFFRDPMLLFWPKMPSIRSGAIRAFEMRSRLLLAFVLSLCLGACDRAWWIAKITPAADV
jgi:hypothetical protein